MSTLVDVMEAVQEVVEGVTGIRFAPVYAPELIEFFPAAVSYPGESTWEVGPVGSGKALQSVVVEIHLARVDLARDIQAAMPFADSVPLALLSDATLGGSCQTFRSIRGSFGPMGWNGVATIGFRFFVEGIKLVTSF